MGIIIDVILVAIILLSVYLGYRKGLIELGTKVIAGIVALIVALVLFKPIGTLIINNTGLDENIEKTIEEKAGNLINNGENSNAVITQTGNIIIQNQSRGIALSIIYSITAIILFILAKIILSIVVSLMDFVAKLPILKQFNEAGGIIYGLARGIIIAGVCAIILGIVARFNPGSSLDKKIEETYLTKFVCEKIVKF